jgi:alpha-D-ribose 1-methylphosphonate 5-phosphate C-P lyase
MSQLIIEDEDYSACVPTLKFECGICGSGNTFIDFYYTDGNGGQMAFNCYDCKGFFNPTYDKQWYKK